MDMPVKYAVDTALGASVEMQPQEALSGLLNGGHFPASTHIYLTDLGNIGDDEFVAAARHVTDSGLVAVPHLPARRFASLAACETRLKRLTDEAGVDEVLVIGGEPDQPGPIASAVDLIATGLFETLPIRKIAIAGHPEGIKNIDDSVLWQALRDKQKLASDSGCETYIVTQFCFDANAIGNWLSRFEQEGIFLPVHIGIAGPVGLVKLLKFSQRVGVGNSIGFLKKRMGAALALASGFDPETIARPTESFRTEQGWPTIAQLHIYPFGEIDKTVKWLTARGSWMNIPNNAR